MQKWSCKFRGFNKKPLTCKDCINCAKINAESKTQMTDQSTKQ